MKVLPRKIKLIVFHIIKEETKYMILSGHHQHRFQGF